MLFHSHQYALLLGVTVLGYFWLPQGKRWALLLVASYVFYMSWRPLYAILMAFSTLVDYWAGLRMARLEGRRERRKYLIFSLVANLGLLGYFKYYELLARSFGKVMALAEVSASLPALDPLLPLGISFYTFQSLGYSIEVYRGRQAAERHLGYFALYVSFFPQLVAGPIERPGRLLPQLRAESSFSYDRAASGLRRIAWGLFKKLVIADNLARLVETSFTNPVPHDGPRIALAAILFGYQIYCDFSGYTDIAIGSARILGIDLVTNFDRPYAARSPRDFWRRWHISLSTWFRDHVYIPLGGSRGAIRRVYLNIMIVFALSGFWHGDRWNLVVWGLYHGLLLVLARATAGFGTRLGRRLGLERWPRLVGTLRWAATYALVIFGWILFWPPGPTATLATLRRLGRGWSPGGVWLSLLDLSSMGLALRTLVAVAVSIVVMESIEFLQARRPRGLNVALLPAPVRWVGYHALVLGTLLFGSFGRSPFIYFVF